MKRGTDYIGVGVGAIIVAADGRLLLSRRGPKGELLDVVDHILPDEGQHWVSPTFIRRIASGEPVIREPEKCAEIGWFSVAEMPESLTQISRDNLGNYSRRRSSLPVS